MSRRIWVCALVLALAGGTAPGTATAAPAGSGGSPGAAGAGDPFFPRQGNGGYDVAHYDLAVDYTPRIHRLDGVATVTATATQALSRFDLDLRPSMVASSVLVNGRPAAHAQPPASQQELVITPSTALPKGRTFTVRVTYGGTAAPVTDPDGALDGFVPTSDGAVVVSEPQGAPTWFPCNDTPTDKATYTVTVTTPSGVETIANGSRIARTAGGGHTTSAWAMTYPVSTYLVTATMGRFDVTTGTTPGGVPYLDAVEPTQAGASGPGLAAVPDIVDFFGSVYGAYPFDSAGAIVDDVPHLGYALETATRPVFPDAPNPLLVSHELAHQWFGDTVTLTRWSDIWINEGFAQFSQWLYDEHTGGRTTSQHLADVLRLPADSAAWSPPPARLTAPDQIFSDSVYTRGAATLAALRQKVGDDRFFPLLRSWVAAHRYGNATVDEFRAFAAARTGTDLTGFFRVWLDVPGKPSGPATGSATPPGAAPAGVLDDR